MNNQINSSIEDNDVPTRKTPMEVVNAGMKKRKRAEKRFQFLGKSAIFLGVLFLVLLFTSIISKGYGAFQQTYISIEIDLTESELANSNRTAEAIASANYAGIVKSSLRKMFPNVNGRRDKRKLNGLVSQDAAFQLERMIKNDSGLIDQKFDLWVPADDEIDMLIKGHIDRLLPEDDRRVKDNQIGWVDKLVEQDRIEKRFNTIFFTNGDSRNPELAGIRGAIVGSIYTLLVTLLLSFPIGVAAAIYLEEFAAKNRLTDIIEVNINNLAAVPSIVFGLLGLAVFINFFGLPRSAPFVGGLVLTLMTLPTIIISSRAALKSVPPSIKEAALGVGASPLQAIFYHVLPLAMPGMLTGTIIGMAQALGESAPLLMIGMVAFIVDIPGGAFDPSTVLPVQIYLWADSPERAFTEKTSAAIMVLLGFLILMNALAVLLRRKFERRW